MSAAIIWFRRDLRLSDHPALLAALEHGPTLPLFVVDPAFAAVGDVRRRTLEGTLQALDADLRDRYGVPLTVVGGDPVAVVPAVAAALGATAVFVTRDYTPYGRRRDEAVGKSLGANDVRLAGIGTPYAVMPGDVRKDDGTPYKVFTPFSKVWRTVGWDAPHEAPGDDAEFIGWSADEVDAAGVRAVPVGDVAAAAGAGTAAASTTGSNTAGSNAAGDVELPALGEAAAAERLADFITGSAADDTDRTALDAYDDLRDRPSLRGTSALSVDLKWGVLHPRTVLADVDASGGGVAGHTVFSSELAWRDFYADVLFTQPETAWKNLNTKMDAMPVDTDDAAQQRFERWCDGTTGFGIVDAGMRQLRATGWMHNRVRMITASFLVKDLHLPWQWGARYFLDHLVDGDLASNNHGWQWAAGTGTDAAPYFRVFNPVTQAERYDPDGSYVARWVPDPVEPMLDHKHEREEALRRLDVVKAASK